MLHYWFSVVARAITDSLAAIGHTSITILFACCVIAVTALFTWLRERSDWRGWRVFLKKRLFPDLAWGIPAVIVAWIPFLVWFMFSTPYKMQTEEHQRAIGAATLTQSTQGLLNTCYSTLAGAEATGKALSQQVASQQLTINGQQGIVNGQQSTLSSQ